MSSTNSELMHVIHEMRNVLQRISTWVNVIKSHGDDVERREQATGIILECVMKQSELLKQIVGSGQGAENPSKKID